MVYSYSLSTAIRIAIVIRKTVFVSATTLWVRGSIALLGAERGGTLLIHSTGGSVCTLGCALSRTIA